MTSRNQPVISRDGAAQWEQADEQHPRPAKLSYSHNQSVVKSNKALGHSPCGCMPASHLACLRQGPWACSQAEPAVPPPTAPA